MRERKRKSENQLCQNMTTKTKTTNRIQTNKTKGQSQMGQIHDSGRNQTVAVRSLVQTANMIAIQAAAANMLKGLLENGQDNELKPLGEGT